jgi:8-oxo-dGTP pyrophosphatase MutT (NUDIX family)
MGVRSRIAARDPGSSVAVMERQPVAKVFGPGVPESFRQGEIASQMTPSSPFSPGQPIGPYDGYDRFPRAYNFQTGYNIATRPRTHERVNFETLTSLVRNYDVAQIAIWHRIDSIRSLKWKLLSSERYFGDVSDAIPLGLAALKKPDRKRSFKTWLAMYLWDILATDSGCLYRMRNRGGRAVGLKVVSGPTIAPLLDYWGDSPDAPAEAYVQYINGLPWGWLTRDDVIYEPFRPQPDSPYGTAPIESIILNANTDIRFQLYFLQRFTDGNLPAAFAAAPDSWSPEQIEAFQAYWDAMMFGDQAGKHQVKWMPPGSKFQWSNEKDFSDEFSLFLMRKTSAAYHVVPSDLGFTENVNRSSGESQADVQHRVGDLPLIEHVEGIVSMFLEDDLGLPLRLEFDRGEEQVDRLAQAQADQAYMDRAVVSSSEIREMRYGLTDSAPVPRVFFSERAGPIPIISLLSVAGGVDEQTAAPEPGAKLPHEAFTVVEGVVTSPPLLGEPLAEQEYGPSAVPAGSMPVTKEGEAGPGISAETGLYGNPLIGAEDEDEDEEHKPSRAEVEKELGAYRNYRRKRRSAGEWHDFEFRHVPPVRAHNLNDAGRLAVRKAAGEVAVAGLAVQAADTGRVLMLQRALADDDPAAGTWEFPGGHIEQGETPLWGAWREWAEECGVIPPPGVRGGTWTSPDGVYQGIVWTVDTEASVPVRCDTEISNPDDPDGDQVEAIAWWDPETLPGNAAVRPELLTDIDAVMTALGCGPATACCGAGCCTGGCCCGSGGCQCGPDGLPSDGDESTCPCGTPVVYDEMNGWQHADGSVSHDDGESVSDKMGLVAKAADARPKEWPGWTLDLRTAGYWAPLLAAALTGELPESRAEEIARGYLAAFPPGEQDGTGRREQVEAVTAWLAAQGLDLASAIQPHVHGIIADAHLIGAASAAAMVGGGSPDLAGWQPGDSDTARQQAEAIGAGTVLGAALAQSPDTASQAADGFMAGLARTLIDGATSGLGAAAIGASLTAYLGDPANARRSVLGLLAAGIGAAALAIYRKLKVQRVRWITEDDAKVCPACEANAAASPYKLATAPQCPAHNGCRCACVPG